MSKREQIVEVTWQDSSSYGAWAERDARSKSTCDPITSVGYVLKRDRGHLTLCQSITHRPPAEKPDHVNNTFVIPRGCIKSIRRIE